MFKASNGTTNSHTFPTRRTVPASAVLVLIEALRSIDGDVPGALSAAGLTDSWHALESRSQSDISRIAFARLAQDCVLAFHFHACRRDALRPLPVQHFRLMCIAMLACPTLRTALEVAADFHRMALDGRGHLELHVDDGRAILTLDTEVRGRQSGDMLVAMFGLAAFHRLLGWLAHAEIPLTGVALNFPPVRAQSAFNELLQLQPAFDQAANSISFSAHFLDYPVVRNFSELSQLLALFPFDLLPPDYGNQRLSERARAATSAALARQERPPTLDRLANMFGLTIPTFRRRMADEKTSLTEIRAQCQSELAFHLLDETSLTVKEIAYRMQFADAATFRRAFRNWTGRSPQSHRSARRLNANMAALSGVAV